MKRLGASFWQRSSLSDSTSLSFKTFSGFSFVCMTLYNCVAFLKTLEKACDHMGGTGLRFIASVGLPALPQHLCDADKSRQDSQRYLGANSHRNEVKLKGKTPPRISLSFYCF